MTTPITTPITTSLRTIGKAAKTLVVAEEQIIASLKGHNVPKKEVKQFLINKVGEESRRPGAKAQPLPKKWDFDAAVAKDHPVALGIQFFLRRLIKYYDAEYNKIVPGRKEVKPPVRKVSKNLSGSVEEVRVEKDGWVKDPVLPPAPAPAPEKVYTETLPASVIDEALTILAKQFDKDDLEKIRVFIANL